MRLAPSPCRLPAAVPRGACAITLAPSRQRTHGAAAPAEGERVAGSETGRDPVPGKVIRSVEIPARHGAAIEVGRGEVVRVIDVSGEQVGDLVCFNRDDLTERYS